jgi:hypothetical protein
LGGIKPGCFHISYWRGLATTCHVSFTNLEVLPMYPSPGGAFLME